jgi:hypothetical protein
MGFESRQAKKTLFSPNRPERSRGPASPYLMGTEISSNGVWTVNWPESDAVHASSFTAEFKSEWNYRYEPHNNVSVNDGLHIRRWYHKIIIL